MWVPIDDPTNSARNGWGDIDRDRRQLHREVCAVAPA
jgi:hypothetical protein